MNTPLTLTNGRRIGTPPAAPVSLEELHHALKPRPDGEPSTPIEPAVKSYLAVLIDRLAEALDTGPTHVGRMITGDPDTYRRLLLGDTSMRLSRADEIAGAVSYLWPKDRPWPEGLPRHAATRPVIEKRAKEKADG